MNNKVNLLIVVAVVITSIGTLLIGCDKEDENKAPSAVFTVSPNSGTTQTLFSFDASGSNDSEDPSDDLKFRWDFDDDNNWDTDWLSQKTITTTYSTTGTYNPRMEVVDTDGATGQALMQVVVSDGGGGPVYGSFHDSRDGTDYTTVVIGNQEWFAENINFQTTNSWFHKHNPDNGPVFGRLYTWEDANIVCPAGWHLPSDDEWKQLELYLGMSQSEVDKQSPWRGTDEGSKMKSASGWSEDGNGTNSSGFSGLAGGFKYVDDNWPWDDTGYVGWWWSSSEYSGTSAWNRSLSYSNDQVERDEDPKLAGLSVRCVKD